MARSDGVDVFCYKPLIPLGFRDEMNFKNSPPPEGCPKDGVVSLRDGAKRRRGAKSRGVVPKKPIRFPKPYRFEEEEIHKT